MPDSVLRARALVPIAAALVTITGLTVTAPAPAAASVQRIVDGPNNSVSAMAQGADGTTYLGGSFTGWGPQTGGGAVLDPTSANVDRTFPQVRGAVKAAVSDGSGGWYIGGSFSAVDGVTRSRLAHIRSDGSLDANWNPAADSDVNTLAVANGVVYVGGFFTTMCGAGSSCGSSVTRSRMAAINPDGTLTTWNPNANGDVNALAVADGIVYAGGVFSTLCGSGSSCDQTAQPREYLAAINPDGTLAAWHPTPNGSGAWVQSLAISGSRVYVGGRFTSICDSAAGCVGTTVSRKAVAAVGTDGTIVNWAPDVTTTGGAVGTVRTMALSGDGATLYVGGDMTAINGTDRYSAGAINTSDGTTAAWNPTLSNQAKGLTVVGTTVYVAGDFTSVCGTSPNSVVSSCGASSVPRKYLAAFGSDGSLASWDPNVGAAAAAVATDGNKIYVGGSFSVVGTTVTRNRLAAIDTNGALTSWNPNPGGPVAALAVANGVVYAGGSFTTMCGPGSSCDQNAVTRNRLAAINTDGTLTSWNPNPNNGVTSLAVANGVVYAGGFFTTMCGSGSSCGSSVSRRYLAAINTDGTLRSWNPNPGGPVAALAVANGVVYAGGSFTTMCGSGSSCGSSITRNRLAAINTDGTLTSWNPNPNGSNVTSLAVANGVVYAGGSFITMCGSGSSCGSSVSRKYLAAINTDGTLRSWNPNADITVTSLAVANGVVYAGGGFTTLCGSGSSCGSSVTRNRLAAINTDGTLTSWNPTASGTVTNLVPTGTTVRVGGTFNWVTGTTTGTDGVFLGTLTIPPDAPGQPTAAAGDEQATVTVTPAGSAGIPASYTVTASPDGHTCTVTGATGSCTVTGLTNGQPYTFTTTATNTTGTSPASPASEPVTPRSAAQPPTVASVTITGTPHVGEQLTAAAAGISGTPPPDLTWQWQSAATDSGPWTDLPAATAETVTPSADLADAYLRAVATATNTAGTTQAHAVAGPVTADRDPAPGPDPAAQLSVTPTAIDFPNQRVGDDSPPRAATVSNTGATAIQISGVTLTGPDTAQFTTTDSCSDTPLAPGASCTLTAAYTPTLPGPHTAAVDITTADPGATATVDLTGTTTAPLRPTRIGVKALPRGAQVKADQRTVLVSAIRTDGHLTGGHAWCELHNNRLTRRQQDRLCDLQLTLPTPGRSPTAAVVRRVRLTARPTCTAGLTLHVRLTAEQRGARPGTWRRAWTVADAPRIPCPVAGTG